DQAVAIPTAARDLAFLSPTPHGGARYADMSGDLAGGEVGRSRDADANTHHPSRFHTVSSRCRETHDMWARQGKKAQDFVCPTCCPMMCRLPSPSDAPRRYIRLVLISGRGQEYQF